MPNPSVTQKYVDGRAKRWESHRVNRHELLLERARQAIHYLGPGASMTQIAAHIGTSKAILYRYFADRNQLISEICEVSVNTSVSVMLKAAQKQGAPQEQLRNLVVAYLRLVSCSPNIYELVVRNRAQLLIEASQKLARNTLLRDNLRASYAETGQEAWEADYRLTMFAGTVIESADFWIHNANALNGPTAEELSDKLISWLL